MARNRNAPDRLTINVFEAAERLYRATLKLIDAGRSLQDEDADSPGQIAFTVAMEALKERIPCPDWAADQVSHDWERFEQFKCRTIGEAFGIREHTHLHAKQAEMLCAYVYSRVRELQRKQSDLPLKDNANGKGALSIVGDDLHMSGKQVEKLMTRWRKLCKECGSDPDERPKYADAGSVIAEAIARALRPGG